MPPINAFRSQLGDLLLKNFFPVASGQIGFYDCCKNSNYLFAGSTTGIVERFGADDEEITRLASGAAGTTQKMCTGSNDRIFIATSSGVPRYSDDDGASWNATTTLITNVVQMVSDRQGNIFLCGTLAANVDYSSDNGATWNGGVPSWTVGVNSGKPTQVIYVPDTGLWVAGHTTATISTSPDGFVWTTSALVGPATGLLSIGYFSVTGEYFATDASSRVWKSTDLINWTQITTAYLGQNSGSAVNTYQWNYIIESNNFLYLVSANMGCIVSSDGISFEQCNVASATIGNTLTSAHEFNGELYILSSSSTGIFKRLKT